MSEKTLRTGEVLEHLRRVFDDEIGERLCAASHGLFGDQRCHGCTSYLAQKELASAVIERLEDEVTA